MEYFGYLVLINILLHFGDCFLVVDFTNYLHGWLRLFYFFFAFVSHDSLERSPLLNYWMLLLFLQLMAAFGWALINIKLAIIQIDGALSHFQHFNLPYDQLLLISIHLWGLLRLWGRFEYRIEYWVMAIDWIERLWRLLMLECWHVYQCYI